MRAILILILLTGCSQNQLAVHTDFMGYENLASFHVGTPDPELYCPDYGQRLHITWNVPCHTDLVIRTTLRFKDLTETEWVLPLTEPRGRATYFLVNEAYDEKGGILTYKVDLFDGEKVIEEQKHALWTELILFK